MDLKNCRVLVTPTSYGKNDPSLKTFLEERVGEVIYNPTAKPLGSAQLQPFLKGVDGPIAGLDEIDGAATGTGEAAHSRSRRQRDQLNGLDGHTGLPGGPAE
jgi:hypothetical protein